MLINRRLSKDTSNLLVKLLKNLKRIWKVNFDFFFYKYDSKKNDILLLKYLVEIGKNKVDNWKCGK